MDRVICSPYRYNLQICQYALIMLSIIIASLTEAERSVVCCTAVESDPNHNLTKNISLFQIRTKIQFERTNLKT